MKYIFLSRLLSAEKMFWSAALKQTTQVLSELRILIISGKDKFLYSLFVQLSNRVNINVNMLI